MEEITVCNISKHLLGSAACLSQLKQWQKKKKAIANSYFVY